MNFVYEATFGIPIPASRHILILLTLVYLVSIMVSIERRF